MINEKYIRFDWAVKRMLRDKANFDVLEGLITVLLGEKITIEEILESEGNQEAIDVVPDIFMDSAEIEGDNRQSMGGGLDADKPERLLPTGRHQEDVVLLIDGMFVGNPAKERDFFL